VHIFSDIFTKAAALKMMQLSAFCHVTILVACHANSISKEAKKTNPFSTALS